MTLIHCFDFLSNAISSVVFYHNPENRPVNGICVANHTSPIDALVLMCDNCYSLVSTQSLTPVLTPLIFLYSRLLLFFASHSIKTTLIPLFEVFLLFFLSSMFVFIVRRRAIVTTAN